jgi:hypothetical protein
MSTSTSARPISAWVSPSRQPPSQPGLTVNSFSSSPVLAFFYLTRLSVLPFCQHAAIPGPVRALQARSAFKAGKQPTKPHAANHTSQTEPTQATNSQRPPDHAPHPTRTTTSLHEHHPRFQHTGLTRPRHDQHQHLATTRATRPSAPAPRPAATPPGPEHHRTQHH